jgi:putative tryptophan/tyrosine transport system substrate-binding protein
VSKPAIELTAAPVHNQAEIEAAFAAVARTTRPGLIIASDPFMVVSRALIQSLVERHQLPTMYGIASYDVTAEGGLMSYGPDTADIFRRCSSYVDRILKGEKPGDLPVQAPTKYELVINLKTAKALGLNVPDKLLALADRVIE